MLHRNVIHLPRPGENGVLLRVDQTVAEAVADAVVHDLDRFGSVDPFSVLQRDVDVSGQNSLVGMEGARPEIVTSEKVSEIVCVAEFLRIFRRRADRFARFEIAVHHEVVRIDGFCIVCRGDR